MQELLTQLFDLLGSLAPDQYALLVVAATAALVVIGSPRIALGALALQYLLLALLIGPRVYGLLVLARIGLGLAVCLILFISVNHIQPGMTESSRHRMPAVLFRLAIAALSGLAAYGLLQANVLHLNRLEGLVSYYLTVMGLLVAATSSDPVRVGLGILTCINGFETASIPMQQGLFVIGMWGVVDILIALTIASGIEGWLMARSQGTKA